MGIHEVNPVRSPAIEYGGTLNAIDQARANLERLNFGAALGYLEDIEDAKALINDLLITLRYDNDELSTKISKWWRIEGGQEEWRRLRENKSQKCRDDIIKVLNQTNL